jgi:hypothetical protein
MTVTINPGESIQAAVDANPGGTTFILTAGVHPGQQVSLYYPKSNDIFIGEPGAIMDGLGTLPYAFTGTVQEAVGDAARGVTLRGIIIQNYYSQRDGAIHGWGQGWGWTVEDCEIRNCLNIGMRCGTGWKVLRNHIHHNGSMGIAGSGQDYLVEGNEIAWNNTQNVDPGWEAGGSKFVWTQNAILRGNFVHHNKGPGLWCDGNHIGVLYEDNVIQDNYGAGIDHEIGFDAVIRNNLCERNGFGYTGWIDGAGILVSSSKNVEVYGNTVRLNNDGIAAKHTRREAPGAPFQQYGAYELKNLYVHDNIIEMATGQSGIARDGNAVDDPVWSMEWNNRFRHNAYTIGEESGLWYYGPGGPMTKAQWQGIGQDLDSTWGALPPPVVKPAKPAVGAERFLVWDAVPGATSYRVQFKVAKAWTPLLWTEATRLPLGGRGQFRVRAENEAGCSPWAFLTV